MALNSGMIPPKTGQGASIGSPPSAPKIKTMTHVIAMTLASWIAFAAGFIASPAGQSLVHQYPKLSMFAGIVTAAAGLAATYYTPKA